ncbi:MAG: c-type cytochrome [Sandaracinus sp.]
MGAPLTPERTVMSAARATLAVPLGEGQVLVDDGTSLALVGDTLAEPVPVGASGEIGALIATAPYDGATLIAGEGGLFVIRDGRLFRAPVEMGLAAGETVTALASASAGGSVSDLWIASDRALYRYAGATLTPVTIADVPLAGARLADAGQGAVWVATDEHVLRIASAASGTTLEATVLGAPGGAESIAVDADGTLWLVSAQVLYAWHADRHLVRVDLPSAPRAVIATLDARDVWIPTVSGAFHAIDGVLRSVEGFTGTALGSSGGALFVAPGTGVDRLRARHPIVVEGLVDGQELNESTDVHLVLAASAHASAPTLTLDGAPVMATGATLTLDPTTLAAGGHVLEVRVRYDDGTLEATRRVSFSSRAVVTWTGDIQPLYVAQCARCHGPSGPSPTRLDTRADWMSRSASVLDNVRTGRMPLGGPMLPEGDIARIALWVENGFPE